MDVDTLPIFGRVPLFLSQHFLQKWDDDRQIFMHCSPDNFCVDPKILVC